MAAISCTIQDFGASPAGARCQGGQIVTIVELLAVCSYIEARIVELQPEIDPAVRRGNGPRCAILDLAHKHPAARAASLLRSRSEMMLTRQHRKDDDLAAVVATVHP